MANASPSGSASLFNISRDYSTSQDPYYSPDEQADPIGNMPISLDSLRDGPPGTKPFYPYSTLLRYAIKGSPNQKLLLEDIYYALESRFPYFKTAPSGWKACFLIGSRCLRSHRIQNSIRHNLTLNPCFEKIARPLTDRGKGSYWIVNDSIDPRTGVHRVRKKQAKAKSPSESEEREVDYLAQPSFIDHTQYINPQGLQQPPPGHSHYPQSAVPNIHMVPNHEVYPPGMVSQYDQPPPGTNFELAVPPPPHLPGPYNTDANGNPDWRSTWAGELQQLRDVTAQQDLAQVDEEWYRYMFERLRASLTMPPQIMMPPQPAMSLPDPLLAAHEG
ncbi:winged helix DNA-binding domain-containing protein [Athelia psychrophila]|uniref:Winged helix DNA-binding domain-containing protein n=1 Tax=Athelia psychrophila TaxID=1759441 RepID=A0A166AY55_9AGAM|nr:winged helix DNA-binding domain-containing protein [Fibularhizoctonia sp. CBS 109695]